MSFIKRLFELMPDMNPNAISIDNIEISFETLGIKTREDCDILLTFMDKEDDHEVTLNSILDYRNTLPE